MIALRIERKIAGLCTQCGAPASDETVRCDHCAEKHRRSARARARRTYQPKGTRRCATCRQPGHDWRTCGALVSESEEKKM